MTINVYRRLKIGQGQPSGWQERPQQPGEAEGGRTAEMYTGRLNSLPQQLETRETNLWIFKALPSLEMPHSAPGSPTSRSGRYRCLQAVMQMNDFRVA